MKTKILAKQQAIALRRQGYSYREILAQVPVAKSTLSLWLREVGLSKPQIQRLTEKRLAAARKGAEARRQQRLVRIKEIQAEAEADIISLTDRERWLIGVTLYWAEGSKDKEYNTGVGVKFSNSDPLMVRFFWKWLIRYYEIKDEEVILELYLHETHKHRLSEIKQYWATQLSCSMEKVSRVYYKRAKIRTTRKRVNEDYYGLIRLCVRASSGLNRRLACWANRICQI
jgi:hypothetical protein